METEDYILLSDIHNFSVCKRRWALRALENQQGENWRTVDGTLMHEKAHNGKNEKRGDTIIVRALQVVSHALCLTGVCDIVEFYRSQEGVALHGYKGKYVAFPVEYKRGVALSNNCDKLQLCAQAMCLEEMLLCKIPRGALFYGKTHRRVEVEFDSQLRQEVTELAKEIHKMAKSTATPKAVQSQFCAECSLADRCLPYLQKQQTASQYLKNHLEED